MLKLMLTGANGFLGRNLERSLWADGHVTYVPEGTWSDRYSKGHTVDVAVSSELHRAMKLIEPDMVLHLAARKGSDFSDKDVADTLRSNVDGMMNVIRECEYFDTPLIHFGTTSYYQSGWPVIFINEQHPMEPRNIYATTKLLQNQLLEKSRVKKWMIIEPVFIYGNLDDSASGRMESVPDIMKAMLRDKTVPDQSVKLDTLCVKDYTHIKDFCYMMSEIVNSPHWGERLLVGADRNSKFCIEAADAIYKLDFRLKFDSGSDYKKNQAHDYTKLYKLYPQLKSYVTRSLRSYLEEA